MMAGIYGFGGGYSESARRKAAGLNDDGSFMPGYSATQGGIADPRGNLVNSRDPFTAGYKQQPLSSLLSLDEWLKTGGAQGPRVQAGQGVQSPQSGFAYTLADLLRNYYA